MAENVNIPQEYGRCACKLFDEHSSLV